MTSSQQPGVDGERFRAVVGHFASGVTVVTAHAGGRLFGTTASAVSSLSLDPPMMLVCLNRSSTTHAAVVDTGMFAVNILSRSQHALARRFGRKGDDKFSGVGHSVERFGLPILDGTLATIVCAVEDTATGGTHTVFLGRVLYADAGVGEPLTYYRGAFGAFYQPQESEVYDAVREWVLTRSTPLGRPLVVEEIAERIGADPGLVHNALVKLSAESVVVRDAAGHFLPAPITTGLVDSLSDARTAIQLGVVEARAAAISATEAGLLEDLAARLEATRERRSLDEFLEVSARYHAAVVGLAGSSQLSEAFRRLEIATVWREALAASEWSRFLDNRHIIDLTRALRHSDLADAKRAILRHGAAVKDAARAAIERHGGAV